MKFRGSIVLFTLGSASFAAAQTADLPLQSLYLEYLEYEQRVHSASNSTELGENTRFDAAFKYRFNDDTSFRLRLDIDPYKYPDQNKSSRLELRLYHRYDILEVQADLNINGDDNGRGATTFGPDTTSDDSWIALNPTPSSKVIFYPYNFGAEIGREFRTLDITRLYYIEGTPSFISNLPVENEAVRLKTVPGLEFQWQASKQLGLYAGIGSVSFLYPAVKDFNIEQNAAAERWKNKEDRAYKAGANYSLNGTSARFEYVTHSNAALTGSLLEAAWSLQAQQELERWVFDFERTWSKAGTRPYRLARNGNWFEETTPFRPIFSDYYGERQDWLGKTGAATMARVGYRWNERLAPFLAYKYLGKFFIYRERESAQTLRTADETLSHGGLSIISIGANYQVGRFTLRPEYEYMQAKNEVFGNRTDIRQDKILSDLNKKNTVLTLTTTYLY